jgi:hypothetical protein
MNPTYLHPKDENGTTSCRILTLFGLSSEKRVATRFHTLNILRESFHKHRLPVLVSIVAEKQIVMFSAKQKGAWSIHREEKREQEHAKASEML